MDIQKGDYVTRESHKHDIVFKVINIKDGIFFLKGVEVRLLADSEYFDLKKVDNYKEPEIVEDEFDLMDRGEFFYLPGKILHIDGDEDYLEKCLKYYKKANVYAIGKKISEENISSQLGDLLKEFKPDIVIITGHDAYYPRKGNIHDLKNYQNTDKFVKAVKVARKYEKSHDKLVVIAGACQSNYEALIEAGANFASSPKRVNIHALDPAIIATNIALTARNKEINIPGLLAKTKYGKEGMGGLFTNGLMYVGYPRES